MKRAKTSFIRRDHLGVVPLRGSRRFQLVHASFTSHACILIEPAEPEAPPAPVDGDGYYWLGENGTRNEVEITMLDQKRVPKMRKID